MSKTLNIGIHKTNADLKKKGRRREREGRQTEMNLGLAGDSVGKVLAQEV